ncbi:hypothetical protein MHC_02550 [Mycoplasma haemocanis str. Illinois]|uniref:Uncharacterized protein n=1 Tax=Mycoplasma haemocanis (strain Illinois) TaxID=1111676 RepID=H6N6V2_MYCHN|nr:hypothetical protein [Mycoplasma haemocanis]AEW45374.1 hypothetical protein MHC_02550 [Mycoplasma haemocanis str. Illinois]
MTDRFLFSILSTTGIISGATSLSFGTSYAAGKYMSKPKPTKYFVKKISRITSIEDIKEYEDMQGCTFLFKSTSVSAGSANSSSTSSNTEGDYKSLENFQNNKTTPINDEKIIEKAEENRSKCTSGAAVLTKIKSQ